MAEPSLYLFDGYNLLHAGGFPDRRELIDLLASFVALRGARGVVVFDGVGHDAQHGALQVRFAASADALLERLAAENRERERVCVVSSDYAVRGTAGQEVATLSSRTFLGGVPAFEWTDDAAPGLAGRLDAATLARLERLRREA